MKVSWVRVTLVVLLGLTVAGAIVMTRPSLRTKAYFAFFRTWYVHWPSANNKLWPVKVAHYFEPFVPVWVQIKPGVTMWLDPYDVVSASILASGGWEPQTWHEVSQHLHPGSTLIDVGAHIGWYSLNAAKIVGASGHVIAVEPNPETLAVLRNNISASGYNGIIIVAPVASTDSESMLTLYAAPRSNTGMSSLSATNASRIGRIKASYQVRGRRLDDIVREAGVTRVDALKIDVEGAEFLVLKGATEILDRYRPVVAVELGDEGLGTMGSSVAEVTAFMQAHGYKAVQYPENNTEFVPVDKP